MSLDVKKLAGILKANLALVDQIRGSALSVQAAADAVDAAREQTQHVLQFGAGGALEVGFSNKDKQSQIMAKIVEIQADLEANAGDPATVGILRVDLANQFLSLANLPNATVASIVQFSPGEVTTIANLIQQAKLDAARRQLMADVLAAGVAIAQAALKVVTTVSA